MVKVIHTSGKRKTAIARGTVQEGTGVYMLEEGKKKIVKAQAWSHL